MRLHSLAGIVERGAHGAPFLLVRALLCALMLLAGDANALCAQMLAGLRAGDIVIRFEPGQERLARAVLPRGAAPFPGLPDDILRRGADVSVLLARDEATFTRWTDGRAPEWGAGVAFPSRELIVLPAYAPRAPSARELRRTLRHELAHVALQRHLGSAQVPRWFTEGYATWTADQLDTEADWLLRVAFLTDRAPPLDSLELLWPRASTDARIAYLLSASAVRYLYAHGGEPPLTAMLERWRAGASLDDAMRASYQFTLGRFERDWSKHVRNEYGWLRFLAQATVLWAIAGFTLIGMFFLRRRHNRRRLERMRANEIPDDPAYWLERADGHETLPDDSDGPPPPGASGSPPA